MKNILLIFFSFCFIQFTFSQNTDYKLFVLGNAQDGGYPQIACEKECCKTLNGRGNFVTSLGIYHVPSNQVWLVDCTPDFKQQWNILNNYASESANLSGIFLTHAHIGHYLGLSQLGREVMGADSIDVYTMPRMKSFLKKNGPWDQLITLGNIKIKDLEDQKVQEVAPSLSFTPILVPHRDEYSETVGFIIEGPNKKVLFIPDIDKWEKWNENLAVMIAGVDLAFIDATFYDASELPGRNMSEIPHPFVIESMEHLKGLSVEDKNKVHFIHMNHSNPVLFDEDVKNEVRKNGFNIAQQGRVFEL